MQSFRMGKGGWFPPLPDKIVALIPGDMINRILGAPDGAVLLYDDEVDDLIFIPDPAAALAEIDRRNLQDYRKAI